MFRWAKYPLVVLAAMCARARVRRVVRAQHLLTHARVPPVHLFPQVVYKESASDSDLHRAAGSALNALLIVAGIVVITFLMVFLYK